MGTTSSLMVFGVGLILCDIEVYNEKQWCEPEQIFKKLIGTNCFLKLESMKKKWLVIADNNAAVNLTRTMYTPPVTPRELNAGLKVGNGRSKLLILIFVVINLCSTVSWQAII